MLKKSDIAKVESEMAGARIQFINDINLVSMMIAVEITLKIVQKNGVLLPAIKPRRAKFVSAKNIEGAKETYMDIRKKFFKMLNLPESDVRPLADKHVGPFDKYLARLFPMRTFLKILNKIEWEHELAMIPVMVYQPEGMYVTYDVVQKKRKQSTGSSLSQNKSAV